MEISLITIIDIYTLPLSHLPWILSIYQKNPLTVKTNTKDDWLEYCDDYYGYEWDNGSFTIFSYISIKAIDIWLS